MTDVPFIQINNPHSEVVMKITRDGVYINPDMAVDEAARKVIEAMQKHYAEGWRMARSEALEEAAKVCELSADDACYDYEDAALRQAAAAIRAMKDGK